MHFYSPVTVSGSLKTQYSSTFGFARVVTVFLVLSAAKLDVLNNGFYALEIMVVLVLREPASE